MSSAGRFAYDDSMADETPSARSTPARRKKEEPSQLIDLFLHVAAGLGFTTDRDIAELAEVSPENVVNWRTGAVHELKVGTLRTIKDNLQRHITALRAESGVVPNGGLSPIEIEPDASPAALQKQFRDSVTYDYLGHRFLYYEPMGALAWESLIKKGYDQERWVTATEHTAEQWLDATRSSDGSSHGPIAEALGLGRRAIKRGIDVVSLGPGEGNKEAAMLGSLVEAVSRADDRPSWVRYAPVDVSIPLLLQAADAARRVFVEAPRVAPTSLQVKAYCADFEEGPLRFVSHLPSAVNGDQPSLRLVLMLGNTFGNMRDEEGFVRQKLRGLLRRGDLVWLEIGLRMEPIEADPLFRMTTGARDEEGAAEANRRLLLEGPYRRWESALGRKPAELDLRVWLREDDDTARVPGSINFCHDLVIKDDRRVCTMLYSRRYALEPLTRWLEKLDLEVLRIAKVEDSRGKARVAHLLLRRR